MLCFLAPASWKIPPGDKSTKGSSPFRSRNLPSSMKCYFHLRMQALDHMAPGSIHILTKSENMCRGRLP